MYFEINFCCVCISNTVKKIVFIFVFWNLNHICRYAITWMRVQFRKNLEKIVQQQENCMHKVIVITITIIIAYL